MKVLSALGVMVGCVALASCMQPRVEGEVRVSSVWVCHGDHDRRWQRVNTSDRDSHRGHGDRVTTNRQDEGQPCDNSSDSRDRHDH